MIQNENNKHNLLILYDGDCAFCCKSTQFVIHHNTDKNLYFAALQSETSQHILRQFSQSSTQLNTLYFYENGILHQQSTAVLHILTYLDWPVKILHYLKWIPKKLRDKIYQKIAMHRHQFFKNKSCWVPDHDMLHRFLKS